MEAIKEIFVDINSFLLAMKINAWYVLLWVSAGFIQKQYFSSVFPKLSEAWKTLILGSLLSIAYAILLRDVTTRVTWVEFFASYIFATSLYELLLKKVSNWMVARIERLFKKKLEVED